MILHTTLLILTLHVTGILSQGNYDNSQCNIIHSDMKKGLSAVRYMVYIFLLDMQLIAILYKHCAMVMLMTQCYYLKCPNFAI